MGRYYRGQICGKFWFAIQSSDDASNFGVPYKEEICYNVCNCHYDGLNNYCINCYSSFEEHLEDVKEEYGEEYDKTWNEDYNEISYHFSENDIEKVKNIISKLEEIVGQYMDSYKIIDENDEITYYISTNNIPRDKLELVARLSLGKQILYCLEKNNSCFFYAEL
jgi:hypothetical protein